MKKLIPILLLLLACGVWADRRGQLMNQRPATTAVEPGECCTNLFEQTLANTSLPIGSNVNHWGAGQVWSNAFDKYLCEVSLQVTAVGDISARNFGLLIVHLNRPTSNNWNSIIYSGPGVPGTNAWNNTWLTFATPQLHLFGPSRYAFILGNADETFSSTDYVKLMGTNVHAGVPGAMEVWQENSVSGVEFVSQGYDRLGFDAAIKLKFDDCGVNTNCDHFSYSAPGSPITINESFNATPYPSTITVTNMGTIVGGISVTLVNLSHTYPADIDMMLVGPNGTAVMLMSDAIGGSAYGLVNNTITFTDSAGSILPLNGFIPFVPGTYKPWNYDGLDGDSFVAPAPAAATAGVKLSAFTGTDPNGVWSLYIMDDHGGDAGSLASWYLEIPGFVCPPGSPSPLSLAAKSFPTNTINTLRK